MQYDQKLCSFMDKYTKAFIVHADNVGSNQMMMIRKARRRPLLQKPGQLQFGRTLASAAHAWGQRHRPSPSRRASA